MNMPALSLRALTLRYAGFALVATACNLLTQRLVLWLAEFLRLNGYLPLATGALAFTAALGAGTLAGLACKYMLDKRWIFHDTETGLASHSRKFALYTGMGVATTAIFWGAETAFWLVWHSEPMRELGAVLGLAVGYVIKYRLDRRFVFTRTNPAAGAMP